MFYKSRDRVPTRYKNLVKNLELIFIKVIYLSISRREIKKEVPTGTVKTSVAEESPSVERLANQSY